MLHYVYDLFRLKKLTHRLFFWMIVFLIFSSTLFLFIYISTDREERISRADAQLQRTLEGQQGMIESWLDKQMEQMHFLSELEAVKTNDLDAIYETFATFTSLSLELEALFYVNEDGDIIIDSTSDSIEPMYELNVKDKPYFVAGQQDTHSKSDLSIQLQDDVNGMIFSSPVYNQDDQFNGMVLGAIDLQNIDELLQFTNLGLTGETLIVNQEAKPLLHVVPDAVKQENIPDVHQVVTDVILHGVDLPRIYENARDEKVLGHYTPIFNGLFYMFHEIKVDEVLKTHEKMVRTIIMIGIGISLGGLLLVWIILRDTQKSIASFTTAIQTIREGNYEYKIDCELYNNSSIEIQETIEIFNSMTDTIRNKQDELIRLSEIDPLTGVGNRRMFSTDLRQYWYEAVNQQQAISLMFIDIDHFKQLNDTYGHLTGDEVLIKITELIEKAILGTTGTLYRYGGEEFIVLFPETNKKTAYTYAENIRNQIAREEFILESKTKVTVSIGIVSTVPTDSDNAQDMVQEADDALYEAKRLGRNQVQATIVHTKSV